jgi:hypothetical protein
MVIPKLFMQNQLNYYVNAGYTAPTYAIAMTDAIAMTRIIPMGDWMMALMLADDVIRFVESGVSITAGSRDARCVPSMARVLGCRVAADGCTLQFWMVASQSAQLRLDFKTSDRLVAVFSQPTTHRTLQIKGDNVAETAVTLADHDIIKEHICGFNAEVAPLGFGRVFTQAFFQHAADDVIAVRFTARELFDQTPGPDAGRKLAG